MQLHLDNLAKYGSCCMLELIFFKMYWGLLKCVHSVGIYEGPHTPSEV